MNELTHTTNRLVVEVEGSSGRRTVSLPAGARIDDLLPGLVELLEGRADSAGRGLAPTGEGRLAGTSTLGESGLYAGAVLVLIEPADRPEPAPESPGWAARVPAIAQRIRTSLRPPAQPKGIDRLSEAEYLRLLEAAIAAPPVQASVVVAVTSADPGAGTTTVTTLLATLLSRLRGEDVVAVDGKRCVRRHAFNRRDTPETTTDLAMADACGAGAANSTNHAPQSLSATGRF